MKRKCIVFLLAAPVIVISAYASFLLWRFWPADSFSISNAGLFGDSFGVINALFSGLAFAGIILTVFLQKKELELQRQELIESRKEYKRSASAQERSAKISAHSALLLEYKTQCERLQDIISRNRIIGSSTLQKELEEANKKREAAIKNLEELLREL